MPCSISVYCAFCKFMPLDFSEALDPDVNYNENGENLIESEYYTVEETANIFNNLNMHGLINYNIRSFRNNIFFLFHIDYRTM